MTGAGGLNQPVTVIHTNNVNAGLATATATYAESANHLGSTDSENFTINQAQSVTTVSCPVSVPYTSLAQTPCTVSVTGGTLNLSPTANYTNNENVGTATASYTYAGDSNHIGSSDSETFEITAIALTINGAVAEDKVYDGDNSATVDYTLAAFSPLVIAGDIVTIDITDPLYAATFDNENVATDKPVTVVGLKLAGADAANYTVSQPAGLQADYNKASTKPRRSSRTAKGLRWNDGRRCRFRHWPGRSADDRCR